MTATDNRAQLDRVAIHVRAAQLGSLRAVAMGRRDAEQAGQFARDAAEESRKALVLLCDGLGAEMPPIQPGGEAGKEKSGFDLASLATLDTENARELLTLLEQATAYAEKLDAERNRVLPAHLPTGPNETRGVDFAESVNELAQRLRWEVFGAKPGRE